MAQPLQCDYQGCPEQGAVLVQRIGTPDVYVWCDPHYEAVTRVMLEAADMEAAKAADDELIRRLEGVSAPELPAEPPQADDDEPSFVAELPAPPDPTQAASSDVAEAPAASPGTPVSAPRRRGRATPTPDPTPGPDDPQDEPQDEPAHGIPVTAELGSLAGRLANSL